MGGQPTIEVAKAVTYDPVSGLIYAQPQTVQTDGTPTFSEIASFDRVTGSELVFRNLNARTFSAGGMAVLRRDGVGTRLIAAQRNVLHTIDFETGARRAALDLSSLGIEDVVGMASDPAAGVLHVLDQRGETPFHVTLDLDALRAEL